MSLTVNRAFGGYITPLPGTKIEGEAIKNLFQGNGNNVGHFESDNASEENLKKLRRVISFILLPMAIILMKSLKYYSIKILLLYLTPIYSGLLLSEHNEVFKDSTLEGNNGWLSSEFKHVIYQVQN